MATKVYKALSDPTRRKILQLLREQDMNAGEIAQHFDSTKPTLSRHFSVLQEADLIQGNRQGNFIIYRLNVTVLEEAMWAMMDMFGLELRGNENEK
ncbi:MAG: winged helix-turn-helix transcriptional regulator [Anaerolineae bacterium]|jgi:ArsR family transcriptional regulator, arsenate/arsenite/antimonite-responsive transcriptional repressor|nr:winged helix-turn-helix transcriptional regulator [Anaerolineae bacterium]MBT7188949.1 winged helix-turn-helix transcriptional regulator [Anaerolineae bacterium]MBT7991451.1 winged helix-turn-helix transcriptional regulator [Anaerolineae bacterium]